MEMAKAIVLTVTEPDSIDTGVTSVAISPDGKLVAAGSLNTVVRIWDVNTGHLVERLKGVGAGMGANTQLGQHSAGGQASASPENTYKVYGPGIGSKDIGQGIGPQ
jgi:WD40 repeat protein